MRFDVRFREDRLALEVADDRLVATWDGPEDLTRDQAIAALREALERPIDFPAMRRAMVPGDHVAFALDPTTPLLPDLLAVLAEVAGQAGVGPDDISLVGEGPRPAGTPAALRWVPHDPDSREALAYLATTSEGHRVYLNRPLVDADVVVPVGRLGHDPVRGPQGPWSVLHPTLSDAATRQASRAWTGEASLAESAEVSWLLGAIFQVGVLAGAQGGVAAILAGQAEAVRQASGRALDEHWTCRVDQRADLVVAGVGGRDGRTSPHDLARGLETATNLVRRGGRIVVLSDVGGPLGPAFEALAQTEDPIAHGAQALKRVREAPDFHDAMALARALAWADLYLLSDLAESTVEDLGMIALGQASEARRLVALADSVIVLNRAEWARAESKE